MAEQTQKGEEFKVKTLVSNLPNLAKFQDPNLVNPWGMVVYNKTLWTADNGSGLLTNYTLKGEPIGIPVEIPNVLRETARPSGLVVNDSTGFVITNVATGASASSILIGCTQTGALFGYNPLVDLTEAIITFVNPGSVYTGIAIAGNYLYVADFHNNQIIVFDSNFNPVHGFPFFDFSIPPGFAPFNVRNIRDRIYVTYAKQLAPGLVDDQPGIGHGFVNVFSLHGIFIKRVVAGGLLNSPWGLLEAPKQFRKFSNKLLVGNFGNGITNVYNFHGKFLGQIKNKNGEVVVFDGLSTLDRRTRHSERIFFDAGINDLQDGIVGVIKE